jgi:hypothetical protein
LCLLGSAHSAILLRREERRIERELHEGKIHHPAMAVMKEKRRCGWAEVVAMNQQKYHVGAGKVLLS